MKGVKLSTILLCGLFLLLAIPTTMACVDVKPGSYPNSVNVNKQGVITIALGEITPASEPTLVSLYLEQQVGPKDFLPISSLKDIKPLRYQYFDPLYLDPYLTGSPQETTGYELKFNVQDISGLFYDNDGNKIDLGKMENLYLRVESVNGFDARDSIRLISN